MAPRGTNMGLFMVLVALLWAPAMAQSGCTSVIISLAPCLNYVTGSSSTPSSSCCSQLATVVGSQPQCLCLVLNGGASSLGVSINKTLALALPGACNVKTPPVSECNAAMSPYGSPVGSPPPGGSKAVPTTTSGGNFSNGLSLSTVSLQLFLFVLFVALSGSTFGSF